MFIYERVSFSRRKKQITRVSAAFAFVVWLVSACGSNTSPFVEQREVTAGSLGALSIGMTSEVALSAARTMGASLVAPIPCADFRVTQSNLADLPPLSSLEGLRVTDYKGLFADVYFADGRVSRLVASPGFGAIGLNQGDDLQVARAKITSNLQAHDDLMAHAIVDHNRQDTVSLDADPNGSTKELMHDCWRFEINSIKPAGAIYDLSFHEAHLAKIAYRRPRLRVD